MLHTMHPDMTDMPEPTSILFHRWYNDPLTRGSYSNRPASFFQEHHDNLRATVDERVWFAGEHVPRSISCVLRLYTHATLADRIAFRVSCTAHGSKGETPAKNSRCAFRVADAHKPGNISRM